MKKITVLFLSSFVILSPGHAQFGRLSPADSIRRDSINRVTQQDYNQMLGQLKIGRYKTRSIR